MSTCTPSAELERRKQQQQAAMTSQAVPGVDRRYFNRHRPTIPQGEFWWWKGIWVGNRINPIHPYNRMEPIEGEE